MAVRSVFSSIEQFDISTVRCISVGIDQKESIGQQTMFPSMLDCEFKSSKPPTGEKFDNLQKPCRNTEALKVGSSETFVIALSPCLGFLILALFFKLILDSTISISLLP